MTGLLALVLACADEELAPLKASLDAYQRGTALLDAGKPAEAVLEFEAARKGDPSSPVLALWEARARAAAGDVPAAEALATEVLRGHPDAALAWYNRAAWRARMGQPEAAAGDLSRALSLGIRSPFEAARDADFAPYLAHPAFEGVLPPAPVLAKVSGPDGAVFVGSDVLVQVELLSAPGVGAIVRRVGASPPCLGLERLVEDRREAAGVLARRVDLYLRATGGCTGEVALQLAPDDAPGALITPPAVAIQVDAPSGYTAAPAPELPTTLLLPGSLAPADGTWAAGRQDGWVWAMGRADQAPTLDGRPPDVKLELRVDAGTRAAGGAWRDHPGPGEVAAGGWRTTVP